jgi:hypothetical protein
MGKNEIAEKGQNGVVKQDNTKEGIFEKSNGFSCHASFMGALEENGMRRYLETRLQPQACL